MEGERERERERGGEYKTPGKLAVRDYGTKSIELDR